MVERTVLRLVSLLLLLLAGEGGGRIEDRNPPLATVPSLRVLASVGDDVRAVS